MLVTPNFEDAMDFDSPIADGTYKARIVSHELKESQKGNKYLNWRMTLFGAEGDARVFNDRTVFAMTMLSGRGAARLQSLLKACGHEPGPFNPEDLYGKEIEVVLKTELDQNGQKRSFPDVKSYSKITDASSITLQY